MKFKRIIFVVEGGLGKNIAATAVVRNIKKHYPDKELVVLSGYPDVFMYNPNVSRTYNFNNPLYLYEDKIKDGEALIIRVEPYLHKDYMNQKRHLIDVWCEMSGVPCDEIRPELFMKKHELDKAEKFCQNKKKILIFQPFGGTDQINVKQQNRDLPVKVAQEIVDELKEQYDILHFRLKTQQNLTGAIPMNLPTREMFSLIPFTEKFLLIDSFMQHAVAAFGKEAVVAWGCTSPDVLGYKTNKNISEGACKCHRPNFFDTLVNGDIYSCASESIHTKKSLLKAIK